MERKKVKKWVGLLLIKNKKMLMVEELSVSLLALPGGMVREGETVKETLSRKLRDELGVAVLNPQIFREYDLLGIIEGHLIHFIVFIGEIKGNIRPGKDIGQIKWVDSQHKEGDLKMGNLSIKLIPELKDLGLID